MPVFAGVTMSFVSLQIKGLIALGIVSLLVTIISVQMIRQDQRVAMQEMQEALRSDTHQAMEVYFDQQLEALTLIAEELSLVSRISRRNGDQSELFFNELWDQLQLSFSIHHLRIVSDQKTLTTLGEYQSDVLDSMMQHTQSTLEPGKQLDCASFCGLAVTIPLTIDDQLWTMGLIADLAPSVVSFSVLRDLDLGVLLPQDSAVSGDTRRKLWDFDLPILTRADNYTEALKQLNTMAGAMTHVQSGRLLASNLDGVYSWVDQFPQPKGPEMKILFLANTSMWEEQQASRTQDLVLLAGVLLFTALLSVTLITLQPLRRLTQLIQIIATIGEKKYDEARYRLSKTQRGPLRDELDMAEDELASTVDSLIQNRLLLEQNQKRLQHLAMVDDVTSLQNRNAFLQDLDTLKQAGLLDQTVLFISDLDGFKQVNDNLGHSLGDKVLHGFANELRAMECPQTHIYRLGSDEFAMRTTALKTDEDIAAMANKLLNVFRHRVQIEQFTISVSACIGIARGSDVAGDHADLMRRADIAMYAAKKAGKNQAKMFDESMQQEVSLRYQIKNDFTQALHSGQLFAVFQPIIDLKHRRLIKFEALARWRHPELGMIRPDVFVQVLEETGQTRELTEWMLNQALAQLHQLDAFGLNEVRISINISGAEVTAADTRDKLYGKVCDALQDPGRIELEITETSLISDFSRAYEWVNGALQMGFKVAIDDFGTGYSSLSYLTSIPFNTVKIDRSLIRDILNDSAQRKVITSIIQMLHGLDVDVVVEGVENREQLDLLYRLNCDSVQGYYIAKPLEQDDLRERLQAMRGTDIWRI